jgi:hypothetical protein
MLGWLLLRWMTLRPDMTANSTLVTHRSFRSLSICLPMKAFWFDVSDLTTVMACGRLSSDRKLGQRLRDSWNVFSIKVFPLSIHESGNSGIIGFIKIVLEVEGVLQVEGGTY